MLLFIDGCDHYTTAAGGDLFEKWTGYSGSGGGGASNPSIVGGRNGNGINLSSNNLEMEIYKTLVDRDTWIIGWALRFAAIGDSQVIIFRLQDSAAADQLRIDANPSVGQFHLYRGNGAALLGSSTTGLITAAGWNYLELKVYLHDTLGTAELRRNGQTIIGPYSGDTKQTAVATARTIRFGGDRTQTGTTTIDDIYACDGVDSGIPGCPNNDFLGDCRVETCFPSGVGNSTSLTRGGTDSGTNWNQVNETPPNDATDYVESDVLGAKDTYVMTDLTTVAGTVYGVQAVPNGRKNDAGTRTFKNVVRSGGVEEEGGENFLGTTFLMYREIFESDPINEQWTIAKINAMEAGVKVHA